MSTATTDRTASLATESLSSLAWGGVVLAAISGVIHLFLGVQFAPGGLGIAFLLAGLGFVGAIVFVLVDYRRRLVYALGVPFTLLQVVLWYYLNFAVGPKSFPADVGAIGAVDKVAQLLLVAVCVALYRRA